MYSSLSYATSIYFSLSCTTTVILQLVLYHSCPLATDPLHLLSSALSVLLQPVLWTYCICTLPILCAHWNLSGTTVLLQPVLAYCPIVLLHSYSCPACALPLLSYCSLLKITLVLFKSFLCHSCPVVACPILLLLKPVLWQWQSPPPLSPGTNQYQE